MVFAIKSFYLRLLKIKMYNISGLFKYLKIKLKIQIVFLKKVIVMYIIMGSE